MFYGRRETIFGGRQFLVEDNLWWKMTFGGKRHLVEENLWWRTTLGCRWPLVEDNLWWILACCLVHFTTFFSSTRLHPLDKLEFTTWYQVNWMFGSRETANLQQSWMEVPRQKKKFTCLFQECLKNISSISLAYDGIWRPILAHLSLHIMLCNIF